jgi:hypothetical protein
MNWTLDVFINENESSKKIQFSYLIQLFKPCDNGFETYSNCVKYLNPR